MRLASDHVGRHVHGNDSAFAGFDGVETYILEVDAANSRCTVKSAHRFAWCLMTFDGGWVRLFRRVRAKNHMGRRVSAAMLRIRTNSVIVLKEPQTDAPDGWNDLQDYAFSCPAWPGYELEAREFGNSPDVPEYLLLPALAAIALAFNSRRHVPLSIEQLAWYLSWSFSRGFPTAASMVSSRCLLHGAPCILRPPHRPATFALTKQASSWLDTHCMVFLPNRLFRRIAIPAQIIGQLQQAILEALPSGAGSIGSSAGQDLPPELLAWISDAASPEQVLGTWNSLGKRAVDGEWETVPALMQQLPPPSRWSIGRCNGFPALLVFTLPEQHHQVRMFIEDHSALGYANLQLQTETRPAIFYRLNDPCLNAERLADDKRQNGADQADQQ